MVSRSRVLLPKPHVLCAGNPKEKVPSWLKRAVDALNDLNEEYPMLLDVATALIRVGLGVVSGGTVC